jgi:hypothetical protein
MQMRKNEKLKYRLMSAKKTEIFQYSAENDQNMIKK